MKEQQLGRIEAKFADIIWKNQPISSTELARKSEEAFGWKKSTTYTVLKRLCEKGIFKNEGGQVGSVISREDFYSLQSERFVDETFEGSLPAFLAAFTQRKALTDEEVAYLRRMVADYKEEE